ncbi:DUF3891 family protein [Sneathiella sp.]|uniref:DUF3891 family protein n=1 Tax=Sneathiella sp. TaxID=1964365 RepID=UPI003569C631
MIVQTAPDNAPRFIMTNSQHSAFAGRMARQFGNSDFADINPSAEMFFVIDHHDHGWKPIDENPQLDRETGLPYHLDQTPKDLTIETLVPGAKFNEAHHPYAGLLAAMHMWGLYNGRYGLSDYHPLNIDDNTLRSEFESTLEELLELQNELKLQLAQDTVAAEWIVQNHLFQNYKQLEFFDALALYFNWSPVTSRRKATFTSVPLSELADTSITVTPLEGNRYAFAPFPFVREGLEFYFEGRYLAPMIDAPEEEMQNALAKAPTEQQTVVFVAG